MPWLDWRYKVGRTTNNLLRLSDLHIPSPDQVVCSPWQKDELRGDLSYGGRGYKSFKWVWDLLSAAEMKLLNNIFFLDESAVNGHGYIYTSVDDGWYPNAGSSFHTFEVNVKRPKLDSQDGQRVARSSNVYSSVAYTFVVLSEEKVDFSASVTSGAYPITIQFTDGSVGTILSWAWDFGDGGTATTQNPSHTYTSDGTYTVSLTITTADRTDIETKVGYIVIRAPDSIVAQFAANYVSGHYPMTVEFTDLSTTDEERPILSWSWTFGDGGTSTEQNPDHTYTASGTRTVALTVTCALGSDTKTKTDYITVTVPVTTYRDALLGMGTPPIAYWTLGDNPGTVVAHEEIGGYDLTCTDIEFGATGIVDGSTSAYLNKTTSIGSYIGGVGSALNTNMDHDTFTIGFCLQLDSSLWNDYSSWSILGLYADTGDKFIRFLKDSAMGNQLLAAVRTGNSIQSGTVDATTLGGTWRHILITCDVGGNVLTLYIDGVSVHTDGAYHWYNTINVRNIILGYDASVTYSFPNHDPSERLKGRIAHLAIWDRILSRGEITTVATI